MFLLLERSQSETTLVSKSKNRNKLVKLMREKRDYYMKEVYPDEIPEVDNIEDSGGFLSYDYDSPILWQIIETRADRGYINVYIFEPNDFYWDGIEYTRIGEARKGLLDRLYHLGVDMGIDAYFDGDYESQDYYFLDDKEKPTYFSGTDRQGLASYEGKILKF